jgi:hypothetical protein
MRRPAMMAVTVSAAFPPGSYTLLVSVPAGYVAVGQTSSTVNVASGSSARANFILQTQGVIQGVVFDDRNGKRRTG